MNYYRCLNCNDVSVRASRSRFNCNKTRGGLRGSATEVFLSVGIWPVPPNTKVVWQSL